MPSFGVPLGGNSGSINLLGSQPQSIVNQNTFNQPTFNSHQVYNNAPFSSNNFMMNQ